MSDLVRYDAMCRAIDAAHTVDEAKDIRDKALALETYAKQALNIDAERKTAEIRIRAERKVGELLKETKRTHGEQDRHLERHEVSKPKLEELGISYDQSSQWQKLAQIPTGKFEQLLNEGDKPTTSGVLAAANPYPDPLIPDPLVLVLAGALGAFERDLFNVDPSNFLDRQMYDTTQARLVRLAPLVSQWLSNLGGNNDAQEEAEDSSRAAVA